jgi:hypothetical protein
MMMATAWIVSVLAAMMATMAAGDEDWIRHGDQIMIGGKCVQNGTGLIVGGAANCRKGETVFRVFKQPYYASAGDVLLGGKGVMLMAMRDRKACGVEDGGEKRLVCGGVKNATTAVRILVKHGGTDGARLGSPVFAKLRGVGSAVDCNGSPMQCVKKAKDPMAYGIMIYLNAS